MRVLIYVAVIGGVAWFSYNEGLRLSAGRIIELENEVSRLSTTTDEALAAAAEAEASEQELRGAVEQRETTLRDEAAAWQQRYEAEVPYGEAAVLWTQVSERLAEGVSVDRLGEVIALVDEERICDADIPTRRIVVATPFHTDPSGAASFADGRISISGTGENATDENGYPVAWYDPAKEVSLTVSTIGGGEETVAGILPIYHNVLLGSDQYRLAVTEGPPDVAIVAAERCDYP
jgi:hypothetical protein